MDEQQDHFLGSISEDGLHLDAVVHVHHPAGLGHGRLLRIQLHLDEPHVIAEDLVVHLMHPGHRQSPDLWLKAASRASLRPRLPPLMITFLLSWSYTYRSGGGSGRAPPEEGNR